MNFPERPPLPSKLTSIDLSTIDERIHLYNNNWIFEHDSKEYIYNYTEDKWILRKRQLEDEHEDEQEDESINKLHIKQARTEQMSKLKQKLSQLKSKNKTTAIFISNLPLDVTQGELVEIFSKYGAIASDKLGNPRVKMYTTDDKFNGQALVIYNKPESVTMAIDMMDNTNVRQSIIKVESAKFNEKKDYINEIESLKQKIQSKHNVVIQNMFRMDELDEQLQQDITLDIKDECIKLNLTVQAITFDQDKIHIKFTNPQHVIQCIANFNNRWYDGLKIVAKKQ